MKQSMTIRSVGQRQRLLEWSQRVADCRQSGMSVKRWCEENGVTTKTYYTWQKKVFTAMVEQQRIQVEDMPADGPRFAELPAPGQISTPHAERAKLAASIRIGNASVDFYDGADPEMVKTLSQVQHNAGAGVHGLL